MSGMTEEFRLTRNLKDAGCNEETIAKYLLLQKEGRKKEQVRLLTVHRASLLDQLHVSQHRIDCLDYLLYEMNKNQTKT